MMADVPCYYLWIDDLRSPPKGDICWEWLKSVEETVCFIEKHHDRGLGIQVIDLDHDAGEYARYGGDYIKILDWLEENLPGAAKSIDFRFHSMNPVGIENMRRVLQKNGWGEIR